MQTTEITSERLASSIIAVPPLARNEDLSLNAEENFKIIRHIEAGGVSTLLYGGNANLYHVRPSEYMPLLEFLAEAAGEDTLVVPSAGPAYGTMMDQAKALKETQFPTAMVLPSRGMTTPDGVETGIRHFVEAMGKPAVLYIKDLPYIEPENVRQLVDDGLISWIKYAIVRDSPGDDPYLRRLVNLVDPQMIVSGIGEQPAIIHLRDFGLMGFTSGCVCVRPDLSMKMLKAIQAEDWHTAEEIRAIFRPLEDHRNAVSPVRVLHEAVSLAGIAKTGPHLPLFSSLTSIQEEKVSEAVKDLLAA